MEIVTWGLGIEAVSIFHHPADTAWLILCFMGPGLCFSPVLLVLWAAPSIVQAKDCTLPVQNRAFTTPQPLNAPALRTLS